VSIWLPLASATSLGICLILAYRWQQKMRLLAIQSYRNRYRQLVAYFEHLTLAANEMGSQIEQVKDDRVLRTYQECLERLERLLRKMKATSPFGRSPDSLETVLRVTNDLRRRMHSVQQAFREHLSLPTETGLAEGKQATTEGDDRHCYFCSRPRIGASSRDFRQSKIQLHEQEKRVWGCKTCCDELEATGKVRVLFFRRDGQPVHWRQVDDYQPAEEYWSLNDAKKKGRMTHLEVVRPNQNEDPKLPN
jgi:hypothetical protein